MVIDVHAHCMPESVIDAMRRRETAPAIRVMEDGQERRLMPAGHTLPFSRETYTDMSARMNFMDRQGIQRQVLSMGLLFGLHCLPVAEAAPLARLFNDDLGELCARHGDRFSGIALLPLGDMDASVAELVRAHRECGLNGAILPANALLDYALAETLRPLFEEGNRLGMRFFIHPGQRPDQFGGGGRGTPDNVIVRQALQVQDSMAHAVATLLFTDFLEPYSGVQIHVANLGGTLAMVIERMDTMSRMRQAGDKVPSDHLGGIYVDCASLGPLAIELAVEVFGADRVMFGSDCPIFRTDWSLEAALGARLSDRDRDLILFRTAEKMLGGGW